MNKADEPAFPGLQTFQKYDDDQGRYVEHTLPSGGLTKREYFAGLAMQAIATPHFSEKTEFMESLPKCVAFAAVQCADALLKELDKK